jgi:hypothetical protein
MVSFINFWDLVNMNDAMDFIRDFLKFVESEGIYDEFDKDTNKMVTSSGVATLIKRAKEIMPPVLSNREASAQMRELTDEERDRLITNSGDRIVDLRTAFAKKMAKNGGSHVLLEKIVGTMKAGGDMYDLIMEADTFVNASEDETFAHTEV